MTNEIKDLEIKAKKEFNQNIKIFQIVDNYVYGWEGSKECWFKLTPTRKIKKNSFRYEYN